MRWMVCVLVASLSGCSVAFVNGPPSHPEELPVFDCTESRAAPVLDTVFAALQAANFAVAAGTTDQQWSDAFNGKPLFGRSTAIPLYIAATATYSFSAYYGYARTGDCRDAIATLRNRSPGTQVGPQAPWPPPPPAAPGAPGVPPAAAPPPVVLPPPAPPPPSAPPPPPPMAPPPPPPPPAAPSA